MRLVTGILAVVLSACALGATPSVEWLAVDSDSDRDGRPG
jgi:hypothetical protein